MAKLAMVFGILVALVGVAGYVSTHFWHALIPVVLGVLLILLGLVANTEDVKRRMLAMHIAVTVGLLGFLGTIPGLIAMMGFVTGTHQETANEHIEVGTLSVHKLAAEVQSATSILCLIFVLLCVRSFIAARRARA
jgi:L-asparagine transporter-like permease